MEVRWLQAFIAVAEELHFGRAATRLQMAQSPLSQTIRKLERDVGTPLFERSTRSVELTAAGHAFLPHARAVLEEIETARRATRVAQGEVYGRVAVGFSGVLNHLSLPPLTRAVRDRHPHLQLDLIGRVLTQDAVQQLDGGGLDIAFVGLPVDSALVRTRLIAREAMGVVLPAGHRFADSAEVDLADLAGDEFISTPLATGSSLEQVAMRACVDAGFRPRVVQEVTDPYMILMLVAAGVGVALMTEGVAAVTPPGAVFVPVRGADITMNHGIAWSPRRGSAARDAVLAVADEVLPTPD